MLNNDTTAADGGTPDTGEKTFTQEQLNQIVGERLKRAQTTASAALAEKEQALSRREFLLDAKETITAKGYPVELLEALNCADRETLDKSLGVIDSILASRMKAYDEEHRRIPPPFSTGMNSKPMGMKHDPLRDAMGL